MNTKLSKTVVFHEAGAPEVLKVEQVEVGVEVLLVLLLVLVLVLVLVLEPPPEN